MDPVHFMQTWLVCFLLMAWANVVLYQARRLKNLSLVWLGWAVVVFDSLLLVWRLNG